MGLFGNGQTLWSTVSVDDVQEVLSSAGFSSEVRTDGDGDPGIVCVIADKTTQIMFYGWNGGRARSMAFRVRFGDSVPLQVLNSLNESKRYVKYYAQDDGRLIVEMDCAFGGGVTPDHVRYLVELWQGAMEKIS